MRQFAGRIGGGLILGGCVLLLPAIPTGATARRRAGTWPAAARAAVLVMSVWMVAGCGAAGSPATSSPSGSPSASGPAWEVGAAPGIVNDATSVDGAIVAVGSTAPTEASPIGVAAAWTSLDGKTWDAAPVDGSASRMMAVARGPRSFVAVGNDDASGNRPVVWTSDDGRSWTKVPGSTAFEPAQGCASTSLEDVAAGPDGFVAVGVEWGDCGQHGSAWFSPDGSTWTRAPSATGGNGTRVIIATDAGYIAAGAADATANEGMRAAFWWSPDGRTWTLAPDMVDFHGAEPAALAATASGFLAIGSAIQAQGILPAQWRSSDGQSWERVEAAGLSDVSAGGPGDPTGEQRAPMALAGELLVVDDGLVATGAATTVPAGGGGEEIPPWRLIVWTSATGESWTCLPDDPTLELGASSAFSQGPTAVVAHGGRLILFGSLPYGGPDAARMWETDLGAFLAYPGG